MFRHLILLAAVPLLMLGAGTPVAQAQDIQFSQELLPVKCRLPPRIRAIGTRARYSVTTAGTVADLTVAQCEARGGTYVAYDPARIDSVINYMLNEEDTSDPRIQTRLGLAYLEKGQYSRAAQWFEKAAGAGSAQARVQLAKMYDEGQGVARDPQRAQQLLGQASGVSVRETASPAQPTRRGQTAGRTIAGDASGGNLDIEVILPPAEETPDGLRLRLRGNFGERAILARVLSNSPIRAVTVGGRNVPVVGSLNYFEIPRPRGGGSVQVSVTDSTGRTLTQTVEIVSTRADAAPSRRGRDYALIIGNNAYQHKSRLQNAVNDAREVANVLRRKYGFEVQLITDATRAQMLTALHGYSERLTPSDRLVIYYSGHGFFDATLQGRGTQGVGYWFGVDSQENDRSEWIRNDHITDYLQLIPANQILLIVDACYAGSFMDEAIIAPDMDLSGASRQQVLNQLMGKRIRTVMTAGWLYPVVDQGTRAGHSVFTGELLSVLESNDGPLEGYRLFNAVAKRVIEQSTRQLANTPLPVQEPTYSALPFAGHESGDFVLIDG